MPFYRLISIIIGFLRLRHLPFFIIAAAFLPKTGREYVLLHRGGCISTGKDIPAVLLILDMKNGMIDIHAV